MIEKKSTQNEVEVLYGENNKTSRKAGLTADSRWLLRLLSKMYSDPYGSVIRELVSNGFDANTVANSENNIVEINFQYDVNYNEYISIRDYGTGMSPDFMHNKFMDYGESTKRESNDAIGMYGIGSKSPFSIRDNFIIISYIDGIAYHYMLYKDEQEIPTYDLEDQIETSEDNGTEIRIYLDTDRYKFIEAIKSQLLYFNDVYVHHNEIDNEYTIYEFKNFVARKRLETGYQANDKADICYKRVRYRINYNKLNLPELHIPIGIKFEIGELMPTPSREDIEYGDEEVILLKDRIRDSLIEIIEHYNKNVITLFDNYYEYKLNYDKEPVIDLSGLNLSVIKAHKYLKQNYNIELNIEQPKYKLLLDLGFKNAEITPVAIRDLICTIINQSFYIYSEIRNGREYKDDKINITKDSIIDAYFNAIVNNSEVKKVFVIGLHDKTNSKINKYLHSAVIIKPKRKNYKEIYNAVKYLYIKLNQKLSYDDKKPYKLYNHFRRLFKQKLKLYKTIELPQEFEEQLEREKLSRAKLIIYRPGKFENVSDWKVRYDTVSQFIEEYKRVKQTIVYTHDENISRALNKLCYFNKTYYSVNYSSSRNFKRKIEVIHLSKSNYDILYKLQLKNFMSETEFYQTRTFKKFCTAFFIESEYYEKMSVINIEMIKYINKDIYNKIKNIKDFVTDHTEIISNYHSKLKQDQIEQFKIESSQIAKTFNLLDKSIIDEFNEILKYLKGLELLNYLDEGKFKDINDYEALVDFFKLKKKRVNDEWYRFLCKEYELQLLNESNEKVKYLKSINKLNAA